MKVRLLQRGLTLEQVLPAGLDMDVTRYSKSVYGGCSEAELEITGKVEQLFELANCLRWRC